MITVEPTRDANWIWQVVRDPAMWNAIGGHDGVKFGHVRQAVQNPANQYLMAKDDERQIGFVVFMDRGQNEYGIHLCLTDRGGPALEASKAAVKWIFEHTPRNRIVGQFDQQRKDVRLFLGWMGFKPAGKTGAMTTMEFKRQDQ